MALNDLMPERSPFQLTRSCRQFLAALAGKRALGNWSQHSLDVLHHRPDCFGGFLVGQPNFWIPKDDSKFGRPPFSKTTHRRCVLLESQGSQTFAFGSRPPAVQPQNDRMSAGIGTVFNNGSSDAQEPDGIW